MKPLLDDIRWNDARTRWLLEHAAAGLDLAPPPEDAEELAWVTEAFSDASAMTLYLAARNLVDAGRPEEALEVLGDACQAELASRPTVREMRAGQPR
jgi:hypothetical protein